MMTQTERAPWAQWRRTGQGRLFYWHIAWQHLVVLPKLIWLVYLLSRSFDSSLALRQSCSARLKSLVGCGCKKIHRFRVLIKAFLVKKKGTKTAKGWPSLDQWWHCCTDEPSQHCDRTPQRLRNETDKSFSFRNRITLVFESCSWSLTIF